MMMTRESKKVLVLVPSIRFSGGNKEIIRLAEELASRGIDIKLVCLWRASVELPTKGIRTEYLSDFLASRSSALMQYPVLLWRFTRYIRRVLRSTPGRPTALLVTHFSTFPLAWLSRRTDWYCFNQDVEWMFVAEGFLRKFLRQLILATSRRAKIITTNAYINKQYENEGILSFGQASIWPSNFWLSDGSEVLRDVDVAMFLRRGHMKRLDLCLDMLGLLREAGISCIVITPDPDLYQRVLNLATHCLLRPSDDDLKSAYARSKIFLMLSETEGFGLPPLEAMGSGCVPLCRDSGGPQSYMWGRLAHNLVPLTATNAEILRDLVGLLSDPQQLSSLSRECRLMFKSGAAMTIGTRTEFLDRLASSMTDSPPSRQTV